MRPDACTSCLIERWPGAPKGFVVVQVLEVVSDDDGNQGSGRALRALLCNGSPWKVRRKAAQALQSSCGG